MLHDPFFPYRECLDELLSLFHVALETFAYMKTGEVTFRPYSA